MTDEILNYNAKKRPYVPSNNMLKYQMSKEELMDLGASFEARIEGYKAQMDKDTPQANSIRNSLIGECELQIKFISELLANKFGVVLE